MATEKKETAQRDENGVRKQSYKRFKEGATMSNGRRNNGGLM